MAEATQDRIGGYIVDYPHLCRDCRRTVKALAVWLPQCSDEYASDEEGPIMLAYDRGLLCGPAGCEGGEGE